MTKSNIHPAETDYGEDKGSMSYADRKESKEVQKSRAAAKDKSTATASQREIAGKAHRIIMDNLEHHITIAEFAQLLHASPTQIKSCFHKIYGVPIYTYARSQRMEAAARLLSETDESILEIAGKFGYENGSKFAQAFRSVMGSSPSEYRRCILWERENRALMKVRSDEKNEGQKDPGSE